MVYIGRAVGIGCLKDENKPVVLYAVSGRSPESKARIATIDGEKNIIFIRPSESEAQDDPLRHYAAMIVGDNNSIFVSNGRQTPETVKRYSEVKKVDKSMSGVLDSMGAEPDSYHTPRISAGLDFVQFQRAYFGIINHGTTSDVWHTYVDSGKAILLPTYKGDPENPAEVVVNDDRTLYELELPGDRPETAKNVTAQQLADRLFEWMDKTLVVAQIP